MRNMSKETIGLLIMGIMLVVIAGCEPIPRTEQVIEIACEKTSPTGKGIRNIHLRGTLKVKIVEGSCQVIRIYEQAE